MAVYNSGLSEAQIEGYFEGQLSEEDAKAVRAKIQEAAPEYQCLPEDEPRKSLSCAARPCEVLTSETKEGPCFSPENLPCGELKKLQVCPTNRCFCTCAPLCAAVCMYTALGCNCHGHACILCIAHWSAECACMKFMHEVHAISSWRQYMHASCAFVADRLGFACSNTSARARWATTSTTPP